MVLDILGFLHFSFIDLADIVLVAAIIFVVFRWIRGSSSMNIFIAILLLLLVRIVASALGMKMISTLLGTIIDVGAIALIVIFQPEIRKFLMTVGRSAGNTLERRKWIEKILPRRGVESVSSSSVSEIANACKDMAASKTGALIVVRRKNPLQDIIDTGDVLDARISTRIILNIFFKNAPLHDGAVIIDGDRIVAARCTLPISDRTDLPARFGMRHKAAIGISEQTDADVIVVSEQTGDISFVRAGLITPVGSINKLKLLLGGKA